LREIGLEVSTGKVVDFRARSHLRSHIDEDSVPLIYQGNLKQGHVSWPQPIRKPQALASNDETAKLLLPGERYVLAKRFSSKEEKRRVVAAIYDPEMVNAHAVGFENHLNVFHNAGHGVERELATGLSMWLNSSAVDRFFRTFSGHTQVNATDLRSMRYPSPLQLAALGRSASNAWLDQAQLDDLVDAQVFRGLRPE
jgi:adenine-specific DNA-methyltransferase